MKRCLLGLLTLIFSLSANLLDAAVIEITAVPNGWKVENYVTTGNLVAWFAGSTCNQQLITIPSTAPAEVRNRFFGLVLAAKQNDKQITVRYNNATPDCNIESFAMYNW